MKIHNIDSMWMATPPQCEDWDYYNRFGGLSSIDGSECNVHRYDIEGPVAAWYGMYTNVKFSSRRMRR